MNLLKKILKSGAIVLLLCGLGHASLASEPKMQIQLRPDQSKTKTIKHTLKSDETLWFLAQVYYGQASEFSKILSANGLRGPRDLKKNQVLVIPNPKFDPQDSSFQKRFDALHTKRKTQLQGQAKKSAFFNNVNHGELAHPARQAQQELEEK